MNLPGNTRVGEPDCRTTVQLPQRTVMAYGRSEPLKPGVLFKAVVLAYNIALSVKTLGRRAGE